jgi:hypothetical protein
VGTTWRPGHLLLLAEAFADHLIHRRFHKARADAFAVPVMLSVVGNEALIVLNVRMEFLDGFEQFGFLAPYVQNFTLAAFLPESPRRHNREIINESLG